jgi:glycogen debranching enzyme
MRRVCAPKHGAARRFNRDFWIEEEGCYAMALEAGHRPCRVMSSNPGQALWTGIVDEDKAGRLSCNA